jgi:hypothetical protein
MAANLPADNTAAGIRPQKAEIRAFGAAVEKALIEAARPEPRAEARTFAAVCGIDGLEGIVSKDRGRAYCVGKCRHRIKVQSRAQPAYLQGARPADDDLAPDPARLGSLPMPAAPADCHHRAMYEPASPKLFCGDIVPGRQIKPG